MNFSILHDEVFCIYCGDYEKSMIHRHETLKISKVEKSVYEHTATRALTPSPVMLICSERRVGTSSNTAMGISSIFRDRAMAELLLFPISVIFSVMFH